MFFLAPLIAAGVSALGGALGQAFASSGRAKQEELLAQAMDELGNIDPAKFQELAAHELGPSAMAGVQTDPRLTATQNQGLDALDEIVNSGGLDPTARADLHRATSQAGRMAGANINRIRENLNAQGAGKSAAGAVLQAKSAQDASQSGYDNALNAASGAWARRMDALGKRTGLAGQMRGQEFDEKARRAQAEDSIARYNADARTAAGRYRNQMEQQRYQNDLNRVIAKGNVARGAADNAGRRADETAAMWSRAGEGASGLIGQYADNQQSQADKEWEVTQSDKQRQWESKEREKDRAAGWRW